MRLVCIDLVPVQLAAADVHIDVPRAQPALALPRVAASPEEENNRERQVGLKEAFHGVEAATGWADSDVELATDTVSIR